MNALDDLNLRWAHIYEGSFPDVAVRTYPGDPTRLSYNGVLRTYKRHAGCSLILCIVAGFSSSLTQR